MKHPEPILSVILPTDSLATIQPVLEQLRRLESPERLEVILISPAAEAIRDTATAETHFHSMVVCHVDSLAPLGVARAVGVMAASGRYVFMGETHSFLWPDALDRLLEPLIQGEADLTVPAFVNANPISTFSWASFLCTYARWGVGRKPGLIGDSPVYDFIGRREILTELGDRLPDCLTDHEGLFLKAFREQKRRILFVPDARIDHVNLESPHACLDEFFRFGRGVGKRRAERWSYPRRLAYIAGGWLIPVVLMARAWVDVRRTLATEKVPLLSIPALLLILTAKALGEVLGYAGVTSPNDIERQTLYEVQRFQFAPSWQPR
ncbi:MAG: hypothetical protein ACO3I0_04465 [Limisphaerales bacterium]